jgi:uncharacterized protein YcbX
MIGGAAGGAAKYKFVTGRQDPSLMTIQPSFSPETGNLVLTARSGLSFEVTPTSDDKNKEVTTTRWYPTLATGIDQGDGVAAFLTSVLDKAGSVRLLRCAKARRLIDCPKYGCVAQPEDVTQFNDCSPLSIGSAKSLRWLNERLDSPVTMARFRPNIVVDGDSMEPFEEERWAAFTAGDVALCNIKNTGRCQMTLVDSSKGIVDSDRQPMKTLKRLRASRYPFIPQTSPFFAPDAFFNCNITHAHVDGQRLCVGDSIRVVQHKKAYGHTTGAFPALQLGDSNPFGGFTEAKATVRSPFKSIIFLRVAVVMIVVLLFLVNVGGFPFSLSFVL